MTNNEPIKVKQILLRSLKIMDLDHGTILVLGTNQIATILIYQMIYGPEPPSLIG